MTETCSRWYVVHTQPQAEAKAFFNLRRQNFDAYLPRYAKRRRHARQITKIAAPLFPRYLFVAMDVATVRWRSIQSTFGVTHLVCSGDRPVPVPQGVVEEIRAREDDLGFINVSAASKLRPRQKIQVVDGIFAEHIGLFEAVADDRRVAILLELLGRPVRVFLPEGSVAAA